MGEDLEECYNLYRVPTTVKDKCDNAKDTVCSGYSIGD